MRIRIPSEFELKVLRYMTTNAAYVRLTFDERTVTIHRQVSILTDIGDMFLEQSGYVEWSKTDNTCSIKTEGAAVCF